MPMCTQMPMFADLETHGPREGHSGEAVRESGSRPERAKARRDPAAALKSRFGEESRPQFHEHDPQRPFRSSTPGTIIAPIRKHCRLQSDGQLVLLPWALHDWMRKVGSCSVSATRI
jgi:hypothetical protein